MDSALLKYHVNKNNLTLKQFSEGMGISYNALYKKMTKSDGFSVNEIKEIANTLELKETDIFDIFF